MKKIICLIIALYVFTSTNIFNPLRSKAAHTPTNDAYILIEYLNEQIGKAYNANRCQAFVYNSLVNSLGVYGAKACAYEAWLAFGVSTDRDIPLGAAVYFSGGNYPCGNHIAGHVGLYMGDGFVAHVAQSKVQKTLVSSIESWSGYSYLGWGWQGGYALATEIEPSSFDFWGIDNNITISGTHKFWWKQSGYNNCDVNVDINGTHLATIYQDESGYFSYDFDSTKYSNGTYTIGAVLRDSSGSEKYVTRTININNSTFDFWNFDNSETISGTYKFWWKQSGYSSSTMELYIDGAYINTFTPDESGYFSYLFDSTQYSNGKHIIGVILNDYGTQQKYISKEIYTNNVKSEFSGWTEDCIGGVGSISIYGWVYDVLNPTTSIEIHVYIGGPVGTEGVEVHTFIADQYRPDVNDVYGAGDYHGFSRVIPVKKSGSQPVHVYAVNPYTNEVTTFGDFTVNISPDTTSPIISNLSITDITETGYTLVCTVTDNVNIKKILFPSWTTYNSDDDIIWHEGTLTGNTATCRIDIASHNNEYGDYESHVYAYDTQGNYISASYGTITLKKDDIPPTISNIKITNISATHYTIECQVTDNLGISRVSFPTWTLNDDGDDLIWHEGIVEGNIARCTIKTSDHNNELGIYKTHIYAYDTSGNSISATCNDIVVKNIEMPLCDSTVFRTENKLKISTFLYNIKSPCRLISALYKNGRIIDVNIHNCSSAYEEYVTTLDVDKIKLMIWDNLSEMHPLCSPEIITSDEFITE